MMAVSVSRSATPRKAVSSPIGSSSGATAGAEPLAQLVERALEAGPLAVELVDEDHAGHVELGRDPPCRLGLDLDALDRADHEDGEVGDPQGGVDVADEVGVAGAVEQVDLVAVVLERREGQRQRDAALDLLGIEVGRRGAVLHPALTVDGAGAVEQRLRQGGLAGSAVPDQGDVTDPGGGEALHRAPRSRWGVGDGMSPD